MCQFTFCWYTLRLPTEGWPGWVDILVKHTQAVKSVLSSSRIRTIHQMSMVPAKRSVFSGNWSMPLAISTARCPLLVCRTVSAVKAQVGYQSQQSINQTSSYSTLCHKQINRRAMADTRLMLVTHSQETCTTRVVQETWPSDMVSCTRFFLYKFLAPNTAQLYCIQETCMHVTRMVTPRTPFGHIWALIWSAVRGNIARTAL